MGDRAPEEATTAEREGVVDQQGAGREGMGTDDSGVDRESSDSAVERAGVVDQQGAIAEDLERVDTVGTPYVDATPRWAASSVKEPSSSG
jgi:hypothetical protein